MSEVRVKQRIYIGIDTGVHTGIAVWNSSAKCFCLIKTVLIHQALLYVLQYSQDARYELIRVRVEDARKRSMSKTHPDYYKKQQGVGSVKRDAVIWDDFLKYYAIPYEMVAPQSNMTKMSEEKFRQMTGLFVASNHSRDAACLVFGF